MTFQATVTLVLGTLLFNTTSMQTQSSPDIDQKVADKYSSLNKDLLNDLFNKRDYNNLVRPVRDASHGVDVTMQLVLTDITAVEEMQHQVEINVWARQSWQDEFLKWNPNNFGGKDLIVIPAQLIWLPDITLYNSVGSKSDEGFTHSPGKVVVYHDGSILWSKKTILRFDCDMRLRSFPFDEQTCYLRFGSWSYDGSLLNPVILNDAFDATTEYHENGEWNLIGADAHRKVLTYNVSSSSGNGTTDTFVQTWPELYFTLYLRRKSNFYLFTLLIPYFLISSLSGLVFVLQPDSGEKMGLAITTLLSLVVFNEYVMQIVPPSADYFPLLADYFLIMIVWVGFSVVISAWVLHIYHKEPKDCSWMGSISRAIIFGFMGRLVCDPHAEAYRNTRLSPEGPSACKNTLVRQNTASDKNESGGGKLVEPEVCTNKSDQEVMDQDKSQISDKDGCSGIVMLQSEVYKIRRFLENGKTDGDVDMATKEVDEAPLLEWREAVRIVDKFFFWVYLITNVFLMLVFTLVSVY